MATPASVHCHVPSTYVRYSVLHCHKGDLAPSAPQTLPHPPHHLALDRVLLLLLLDFLKLDFAVLQVRTRREPSDDGLSESIGQGHRISLVTSRFHVDVVHVVLFECNCTNVVL